MKAKMSLCVPSVGLVVCTAASAPFVTVRDGQRAKNGVGEGGEIWRVDKEHASRI